MPESIIRSEKDHNEETIENNASSANQQGEKPGENASFAPLIMWSPCFIMRFVLLLALGLSIAGLLTEGWVNGYYPGEWTELLYTVITFTCWFIVFLSAYSRWVRLGAALSIIWTAFMGIHFCLTLLIPLNQNYSEQRTLHFLGVTCAYPLHIPHSSAGIPGSSGLPPLLQELVYSRLTISHHHNNIHYKGLKIVQR